MAHVTLWKAEPVNKPLTDKEFNATVARIEKVFEGLRATPEPIPPKKHQLPAFYEAEVKRLELKQRAMPEAIHQRDIHDLMTAKACLRFPTLSPVQAYAKFAATKEGLALMQQYSDAPPGPDTLEPQPQMPKVTPTMKKMQELGRNSCERAKRPR